MLLQNVGQGGSDAISTSIGSTVQQTHVLPHSSTWRTNGVATHSQHDDATDRSAWPLPATGGRHNFCRPTSCDLARQAPPTWHGREEKHTKEICINACGIVRRCSSQRCSRSWTAWGHQENLPRSVQKRQYCLSTVAAFNTRGCQPRRTVPGSISTVSWSGRRAPRLRALRPRHAVSTQ